jgi:hypothetical protein
MKNKCNVIRDILPLYVENIISDDTKAFVEAHLKDCPECKKELEDMRTPSELPTDVDAVPLKKIRTKLLKKRVQTVVLTMAIVVALLVTTFAYLTAPKYLDFTQDRLVVTESSSGEVIVSFNSDVTGYKVEHSMMDGKQEYFISAWSTTWDKYFTKRGAQNAIIEHNDEQFRLYYSQNNSEDSVLIYGKTAQYDGVAVLPRLVLGYYLMLAIALVIISLAMLLIFRKKVVVRTWTQRLMLFPVSYIIGHICIKGFTTSTYSASRDFSLIMLCTILIYIAFILAFSLYNARKSKR